MKNFAAEALIGTLQEEKNLKFLLKCFDLGSEYRCDELRVKAFETINENLPGKKLKIDLLEKPEKLRKIVEALEMLNKQIEDSEEEGAAGGA